MAEKYRHYVVYRDKKKEWRWREVAANGKTIADSAEGYVERSDAYARAEREAGITPVEVEEPKGKK